MPALISGCSFKEPAGSDSVNREGTVTLNYAKGFRIEDRGSYRIISVFNPWQNSEDQVFRYVLSKNPSLVPDSLSRITFIKTPVQKVATFSTTHIAFIDTLDGVGSVTGVSGADYVFNGKLRDSIKAGLVRDIGYDQNINFELIVKLNPDVLFLFGVERTISGTISKLHDLGIVTVMCGDYLETHPLGKAEWIKFFGEFYDLRERAGNIFAGIDSSYSTIAEHARKVVQQSPDILSGLPWKDAWHLPGGQSYAARLIHDAGGNYLWSDNDSDEAFPLDLESVFIRAMDADIWINPGDARNLEDLTAFEERFRYLPVFNNAQVYNNDQRINDYGGNDYWESGALRPDLILADLFAIFHPDHAPTHKFIYYRELK
ncbi:MAG: ABC transporter substrate-binding protein [Bacteroidales bacterium]|nr:ABC transporter substrate-binding protein [Bacteroidales bacterium]MBN2698448.1 ABC transporter substrate-binding protein [Bacteroidales bacterium]